ncbi:conserved hypothetical protein [Sporisorium reilianum SRZ2]|uniref:UBL3-like ubiquitin domain-containing protein n=1 Tax=Sporisorium reilianum (strain SRZ2) TaxID=999809 RepID=E6ZN86_SPORE|nr:conserved hypothetical protein [Sporisorium reilianum SRZ2]
MHATERSRVSTCSTDNGSSHAHDDARLTTVVSNLSAISSSAKHTEPAVSVSTSDAHHLTSSPLASPQRGATAASAASSSVAPTHLTTLLTTTGQRTSWRFDPSDTVDVVRTHIWNNWPESWPQPKPESAAYLRLLHLGHILDHPATTLASRGCKSGATTVVHIIVRSIPPPEPVKVEQQTPVKTAVSDAPPPPRSRRNRDQDGTPGCSCVIC